MGSRCLHVASGCKQLTLSMPQVHALLQSIMRCKWLHYAWWALSTSLILPDMLSKTSPLQLHCGPWVWPHALMGHACTTF